MIFYQTSAVWLVELFRTTVAKSLKEAVAAVNNSNKICMVCAYFCVVDNVVYMGAVNNSNNTWHVLISVDAPVTLQLTLGVVLHCSSIMYFNSIANRNNLNLNYLQNKQNKTKLDYRINPLTVMVALMRPRKDLS